MDPLGVYTRVERLTKKAVVVETGEYEARGRCLDQETSPLFTMLPRELREMIWELALAPFEDQTRKFDTTEYFCRPGHMARLKTDCQLLLTCRRVWLEAHATPMLQAEHSFYYYRAAPDARDERWMARLTEKNLRDFGHLHLYCQMFAVEGRLTTAPGAVRDMFLKTSPLPGDFQPRMLHVTLRHTDWWNWEHEAPLRLNDDWVQALLNNPDLRSTETLMLEMETLDYKVDQLEPIVERVRSFASEEMETHLVDGTPTKTKFVLVEQPSVYEWEGPANIDKEEFQPYRGRDKLKYHVVTLVWKLKFPAVPGAFVPHVRRAPRIDRDAPPVVHPDFEDEEDEFFDDMESDGYDSGFDNDEYNEDDYDDNYNDGYDEVHTSFWRARQDQHQSLVRRRLLEYPRRRVVPGVVSHHGSTFSRRVSRPIALQQRRLGRYFADMHKMEQNVWRNGHDLAQAAEEDRRWEFESAMAGLRARAWQAKWMREGSLLRFAD